MSTGEAVWSRANVTGGLNPGGGIVCIKNNAIQSRLARERRLGLAKGENQAKAYSNLVIAQRTFATSSQYSESLKTLQDRSSKRRETNIMFLGVVF